MSSVLAWGRPSALISDNHAAALDVLVATSRTEQDSKSSPAASPRLPEGDVGRFCVLYGGSRKSPALHAVDRQASVTSVTSMDEELPLDVLKGEHGVVTMV
jgi:hypothetical protein